MLHKACLSLMDMRKLQFPILWTWQAGQKECFTVVLGTKKDVMHALGNQLFFENNPFDAVKERKKAFYGCKKLESITIKTKKLKSKSVGTQAWKGIHKKAVIKVPKRQKKSYKKWLKKKGIAKTMKVK